MDSHYTAVLFVISLADYNLNHELNECHHRVNRLIESMELLHSIVGLSYFKNTNFIFMFNHKDIFDRKLLHFKIPFSQHFPDDTPSRYDLVDSIDPSNPYPHEHEYDHDDMHVEFDSTKDLDSTYIINFLKQQFTLILPPHLRNTLRIYITCAIGLFVLLVVNDDHKLSYALIFVVV
ncbi:guanine nucleotide-binding protein alpha subunit, partial [Reticulomyxa filosa]